MDEHTLAITPTEAAILLRALEKYQVSVEATVAIGLDPQFHPRFIHPTLNKLRDFLDEVNG